MAARLEFQDDAGVALTSENFGAVSGSGTSERKFVLINSGDNTASDVEVVLSRLAQNDGVTFCQLALDSGGNPGTYTSNTLSIGTLVAGASVTLWGKVTVPAGATPTGNPRQFSVLAYYSGI